MCYHAPAKIREVAKSTIAVTNISPQRKKKTEHITPTIQQLWKFYANVRR
jgi:hypothetical protein